LIAPRRLVRLTTDQIATSIGQLMTADAAALVRATFTTDESGASFPPLFSTGEGLVIDAQLFFKLDSIAQAAADYARDHLGDLAGCFPATEGCARQFAASLAERAYRRPLDATEAAELDQELTDLLGTGAPIDEAARFAVYAILIAPEFLYRTELGDPGAAAAAGAAPDGVPLTSYETASLLSFMTQGGPPDAELLTAARDGKLASPDDIQAQARRLLATPEAHHNLAEALFLLYRLNMVENAAVDTSISQSLASAMAEEARLFLDDVLWNGGLTDLLTSRSTFVSSDLASLVYGIPVPAGATTSAFVCAELPSDTRAGLFTQAAFLTSRASGLGTLAIRGVAVAQMLACIDALPPTPDDLGSETDEARQLLGTQTGQEQVAWRAMHTGCAVCHSQFDAYGLAMDAYDDIGRYRTVDDAGRPIDTSTVLPAAVGGQPVRDAVDMVEQLAQSPIFVDCLAKHLLEYAFADIESAPVPLASCAVSQAADAFRAGADRSFSALVGDVVASPAFTRRLGDN
jgi:hypothetical protein